MPLRHTWLLAIAFLLAGCHRPPAEPAGQQKAGPYTILFRTQPDPPHVGLDTGFIIAVSDTSGPVSGATVDVQLASRSFNQAGDQKTATETPGWPGHYEAQLTTGAAGQWDARVTVNDARKGTATATFPFSVKQ